MISDKQRLVVGLGTAKTETMNGLRAEVDFATNEAMVPSGVDEEAAGAQANSACVIGAADEADLGVGASRQAVWGATGGMPAPAPAVPGIGRDGPRRGGPSGGATGCG
jgi:hypothetical protein